MNPTSILAPTNATLDPPRCLVSSIHYALGTMRIPERLPDLINTAADDMHVLASDLAKGTLTVVGAIATALWGVAAEGILRQALAPMYNHRISSIRVQAALDAERKMLPAVAPPSLSSPPSVYIEGNVALLPCCQK